PDTDSGVAANGPSMAQCSSIGIHADYPPNQRQDSAFTHVAICSVHAIALKKRIGAAVSPDSQMTCV
ncbi:hypothetical protein V2I68_23395, partial [Pseudomonas viridiflava]|nr:hypothetical protein [Pseudomonas viridiflava]MEE4043167.1 hypothetical protein [Pseudomonas viridiflava]